MNASQVGRCICSQHVPAYQTNQLRVTAKPCASQCRQGGLSTGLVASYSLLLLVISLPLSDGGSNEKCGWLHKAPQKSAVLDQALFLAYAGGLLQTALAANKRDGNVSAFPSPLKGKSRGLLRALRYGAR